MWYKIKETPDVKGHVVYKLWYANKYVVVAGKTIERSIENINTGLLYFFKDTPKGRNPNDIFYNFYCHVDDFPVNDFSVEIIHTTENPYQHLKAWSLELMKAKEDSKCLNLYFDPYIPNGTNRGNRKSWINKGYYLNFMQWKKKQSNRIKIE
jgi:hypothetical protein